MHPENGRENKKFIKGKYGAGKWLSLVSNHLWCHVIRTHCTQLLWGGSACEAFILTQTDQSPQWDGATVKGRQCSWILLF